MKGSPLQAFVIDQRLGHMATPSCKGGWKCEHFAFKPVYCRKAGKKKIKMNGCYELIVFVQLTLCRKQMIIRSIQSDCQETSLKVLFPEVLQ